MYCGLIARDYCNLRLVIFVVSLQEMAYAMRRIVRLSVRQGLARSLRSHQTRLVSAQMQTWPFISLETLLWKCSIRQVVLTNIFDRAWRLPFILGCPSRKVKTVVHLEGTRARDGVR